MTVDLTTWADIRERAARAAAAVEALQAAIATEDLPAAVDRAARLADESWRTERLVARLEEGL